MNDLLYMNHVKVVIDLLNELTIKLQWQAMYQQFRLEPYAVHTTFQYAGTEGKRHRLREAMVFYDPPEYFDAPGKFCMRCLDHYFLLHDAQHFPYLLLKELKNSNHSYLLSLTFECFYELLGFYLCYFLQPLYGS